MKEKTKLSDEFAKLSQNTKGESLTLEALAEHFQTQGHALFILFLCVPFMTPIPIPGLSIIFGMLIIIAALRLHLNLSPWIPKRWRKKKLSTTLIAKISNIGVKALKKIEIVTRPRFHLFRNQAAFKLFNTLVFVILGLILSLPLPPGTNFPPALGIILLAIGLLEEDGIVIFLSYLVFAFNLWALFYISIHGYGALQKLWSLWAQPLV